MYFNELNGKNIYEVVEWIDSLNEKNAGQLGMPHFDYELTLDENGDGELMVGNYWSDGMDYDIENYIIVQTNERVWD